MSSDRKEGEKIWMEIWVEIWVKIRDLGGDLLESVSEEREEELSLKHGKNNLNWCVVVVEGQCVRRVGVLVFPVLMIQFEEVWKR